MSTEQHVDRNVAALIEAIAKDNEEEAARHAIELLGQFLKDINRIANAAEALAAREQRS